MQKYISFLILIILAIRVSGQNNTLFILDDQGNGQTAIPALSGSGFILDLVIDVPIDNCATARVEILLPSGVEFNSLYAPNSTIVSNTYQSIMVDFDLSIAQQVQFNMGLKKDGSQCENVPINLLANISYLNNSAGSCGVDYTTNAVSITPQYTEDYILNINREPTGASCAGGYTKYKLNVKAPSYLGGYKLVQNTITATITGSDIKVLDRNGILIPSNISGTGCVKSVSWSVPLFDLRNNGNQKDFNFYISKKNDCACIDEGEMDNISVNIEGTDPCGDLYAFQNSFDYLIEGDCCSSGPAVNATTYKTVGASNGTVLCSGGCMNNQYTINYNNGNNPLDMERLVIEDQLPNGVLVNRVNLFFYNQNLTSPSLFCYTTNQSAEICLEVGNDIATEIKFSSSSNSMTNRQLAAGEIVTAIKFVHGGSIPAWYSSPQGMYLYFLIEEGISALDDNIASYSALNPQWSDSKSVQHGTIAPCQAEYENDVWVYDSFTSEFKNQTQALPQDVVRVSLVTTNLGVGSNPLATINVKLPSGIEYIGNPTYGIQSWLPSTTVVGNLPQAIVESYDLASNIVSFTNLDIPAVCNQLPILRSILQFDVKIAPGTSAGVKTIRSYQPSDAYYNHSLARIDVNEKYDVESSVFMICDGQILTDSSVVIAEGELIDIIYEVYNTGNVPVSEIQMVINKPSINDQYLSTSLPRNSEFDLEFSGTPSAYINEQFTFAMVDIVPSNMCNVPTSAGASGSNFIVIRQSSSSILNPGEKFRIKQSYISQGYTILGQKCFSDFHLCLLRGDINTSDAQQADEQLELTIGDISDCGDTSHCGPIEDFLNRISGNFSIVTTNNNVEITTTGLSNAEAWYPIWDDGTSGGKGYVFGNQSYDHTYLSSGSYEVCINIENYQMPDDRSSNRCHCKIICQKIEID